MGFRAERGPDYGGPPKEFRKNPGLSEKLKWCLSRSMIQLDVID